MIKIATEEQVLRKIYKAIDNDATDVGAYADALSCIRNMGVRVDLGHELQAKLRHGSKAAKEKGWGWAVDNLYETYRKALLYCAPECFDDYMLYMEVDRPYKKKFYLPRRKQLRPLAEAFEKLEFGELEMLGISLPPGVGKALANETPVLTKNGWKNHGDLIVGDEVIGMDGRFKKVVAVHPKCQVDCLIEFTNGEQIQCHENHEWMVFDRPRHEDKLYVAETKRFEKRKLESGGERGHRGHRYNLQLPKHGYVQGTHKDLPLDPYTFGLWLGDGINKNPTICCAKNDRATIDRIVKNGFPIRWETTRKTTGVLYFGFDMRKQLQEMGLCHSRRTVPKYIPEDYLTASIEQRLELLAGLLDTDGTLVGSKYQFSTAEETLRDSFNALISTFGWRACVKEEKPHTSSSGIDGKKPCFVIGFTPDCEIPCELERKRNKKPHPQRAIGFKSITRTAPKEGNCITVEGDGMYLVGKTMLPTHNSTLAEFGLTWKGGRHPEQPMVVGSHSNSFLRGMYGELLRMFDKNGEYKWHDVFPNLQVINTNAQDMMIDLGEDVRDGKRFMTIEMASAGSGMSGRIRAEGLLYCDDLVSSLEEALSRERMDKLYQTYSVDYRQRKIGNCPELHISTRWSVHDVVGRLEQMYGDDPKAKFIVCPALNVNDESNFDYPIPAGFTTKYYHEQREAMDDASFRALFMGQPVEREGQLYPENELRRYYELPDVEPDAVLAVTDTKDSGKDYCCMLIAFQYGMDFYIEDMVFENFSPEIIDEQLVLKLCKYNVQMCQFESNAAGGRTADRVQEKVRAAGGIAKITKKWTQANKETKIIINSPFIKEHFLFKDNSTLKDNKEYRDFLRYLCGYTMAGKNLHDDAPDALAQLAEYVQRFSTSKVEVMVSPFRR